MRLELDVARLKADDEQVRATAARDLGASGRTEVEKPLLARVTDASPLVLKAVAEALAGLRTPAAIEALERMGRSKARAVRIAAAKDFAVYPASD